MTCEQSHLFNVYKNRFLADKYLKICDAEYGCSDSVAADVKVIC